MTITTTLLLAGLLVAVAAGVVSGVRRRGKPGFPLPPRPNQWDKTYKRNDRF